MLTLVKRPLNCLMRLASIIDLGLLAVLRTGLPGTPTRAARRLSFSCMSFWTCYSAYCTNAAIYSTSTNYNIFMQYIYTYVVWKQLLQHVALLFRRHDRMLYHAMKESKFLAKVLVGVKQSLYLWLCSNQCLWPRLLKAGQLACVHHIQSSHGCWCPFATLQS